MGHFHGFCHGNCDLRYIGGILMFSKLDFSGLKGQFDVKKVNFKGLIAKIGYLRPILTSRTHLWHISWTTPWELCPEVCSRDSTAQEVRF